MNRSMWFVILAAALAGCEAEGDGAVRGFSALGVVDADGSLYTLTAARRGEGACGYIERDGATYRAAVRVPGGCIPEPAGLEVSAGYNDDADEARPALAAIGSVEAQGDGLEVRVRTLVAGQEGPLPAGAVLRIVGEFYCW